MFGFTAVLSWELRRLWLFLSMVAAAAADEGTCAAGGCGDYYWPAQKGTPGRTGFSPHTLPDISKSPAWSWADPYDDTIRATPLIDDRMSVYLTTIAGRVYKFDADGHLLWNRTLPFGLPAVACIHGGKLFSATKNGELLALDMETGQDRWKVKISPVGLTAFDTASVFAYNGTVVSATQDSQDLLDGNAVVVALRAEDGGELWRYTPPVRVYNFQASTAEDGTIVFQDRSGGLYRLGLQDGRIVWTSGKRGEPWTNTFTTGAAVIHDGRVFVTSNSIRLQPGLLHAYALEDGRPLWEQELVYPANQAVAIGPSPTDQSKSIAVVGIGTNPGYPMAFRTSYDVLRPIYHMLDLIAPWLFAKVPAAMAAFDPQTGRKLWHYELPPYRAPATAGDSQRLDRRFAAVTSGANPHNDVICLPDSCSQPVIGPDGTAYQGWQDGRIYAVRDANGDGQITPSEVSYHQLSDGFQGSLALAPGLLAAAPCGGGLYVWKQ